MKDQDWRKVLRGRRGAMIHNLSAGESFWGMIARPTGPLRDVIREHLDGGMGAMPSGKLTVCY